MARLRLLIQMESADAYQLKAQALNQDPRLASAGVSAVKFTGDRKFISAGQFSPELPPPAPPSPAPVPSRNVPAPRGKLRVVIRMVNADSYELKAKALNNDARLKQAGISALKTAGDSQYIIDGDFSPDWQPAAAPEPASAPRPARLPRKKLRIVLRAIPDAAYDLIAKQLNGDPALSSAGISGVDLARGAGLVPVVQAPRPQPAPPRKASGLARLLIPVVALAVIGVIGMIGAGALLVLPGLLKPAPAPTATAEVILPITGPPTPTVASFNAAENAGPQPADVPPAPACQTPDSTVQSNHAYLREGPDLRFAVVAPYDHGDQLTVLGRYNDWYQVEAFDENQGWLYKEWLTLPPDVSSICTIGTDQLPPTPQQDVTCKPTYYDSCN